MKRLLCIAVIILGCDAGNEPQSLSADVAIENMGALWFESGRTDTSVQRYGYVFGNIHNSSAEYDYRIDSVVYHQFYDWEKYNAGKPDLVVYGETGLIGVTGTDWPPRYYRIVVPNRVVPRKQETRSVNYTQMLVSVPTFSLHPTRQTWFWRVRVYASAIGSNKTVETNTEMIYDQSIQER